MNTELTLILGAIAGGTGAMLSFWAGWQAGRRGGWQARELKIIQAQIGQAFAEDRTRRGSNPPPSGKKPQPPGGRLIGPDGVPVGYNPLEAQLIRYWNWKDDQIRQASGYRSINYPDPSPDRRPTNPFNGEPVALSEGRTQRGNGNGGPTTPKPDIIAKPQPPPARIIGLYGETIGYRPMPSRPGANPPPRKP